MKNIKVGMIFFLIFLGCEKKIDQVEVIKSFLEEDIKTKMSLIRPDSELLRTKKINEVLRGLPESYLDILPSQEIVDEKEFIVEVVLNKVSVGGKIVNNIQNYILFKNDRGEYKVDIDATFSKDSVSERDSSKISRVCVSNITDWNDEVIINGKKVIMLLHDIQNDKRLFVNDSTIANNISPLFSNDFPRHLTLKISPIPTSQYYFKVDSLIQHGWIKGK